MSENIAILQAITTIQKKRFLASAFSLSQYITQLLPLRSNKPDQGHRLAV